MGLRSLGAVLFVALGCSAQSPVPTTKPAATAPLSSESQALHAALFKAADAGDVAAFKAVLTPFSVSSLDRLFAAVARLQPAPDVPHGWPDVLADHKALPAAARARGAYPVVTVDGKRLLDLVALPEAEYYGDVTERLESPAP